MGNEYIELAKNEVECMSPDQLEDVIKRSSALLKLANDKKQKENRDRYNKLCREMFGLPYTKIKKILDQKIELEIGQKITAYFGIKKEKEASRFERKFCNENILSQWRGEGHHPQEGVQK